MTPRIVWLASYPKSGNTWLRVFLSNLTQGTAVPADLNKLAHSAISSDRHMFDQALGFDTGDLSTAECARLRPVAYRWMNAQLTEPLYCKAHDACVAADNGDWIMAPDVTRKVIYILRNPLDVVVSLAHHNQKPLDNVIDNLGDPGTRAARQKASGQAPQLEQILGTWSDHVQSWTQNELFDTCVVRYEDLRADPQGFFGRITTFLDVPHDSTQLSDAIKHASFDVLQTQERESGFRERPQNATRFFRRGRVGDWKTVLSAAQIDRVIKDHLPVMQKFGYVDESGVPVVAKANLENGQ
ncbi:sulfotransferase domain-containing protein [Octadecabacter sp. G9-8]|uniref:Sulfotransferase domain-containing protein n=1 Tax=Octadecabacter dasysiphoniae TaxID=2909341 RepID=A0ABS9CZM0_9RHOB|nr:sulfotransferase domain-containing protein [Octadecabacter dasysiphoniae]MCF2872366.1 sulfotransferase domain-containing protein [Octadecabacter dasysiphoniae]